METVTWMVLVLGMIMAGVPAYHIGKFVGYRRARKALVESVLK